jgi:4,5-dihydroxyphthalate decarboxylase
MSSCEVISRHAAGRREMVALPVFPSRVFRHGFITVNRKAVRTPKDLAGKRIGTPLYTQTAALFIRGLLQDEYGVDLSGVHWLQGATNSAESHGHPSAPPLLKPVSIEQNASGRSLSELLEAGEIQAIIGSGLPLALRTNPDVQRLFPDFHARELDYYRRTRIFPIMHLVAIRRDVYEQHPFVAASLHRAMTAAKDLALARCATSARCVTCCRACPPSSTRSTPHSAAIPGPTASRPTGPRWKRWCAIWPSSR